MQWCYFCMLLLYHTLPRKIKSTWDTTLRSHTTLSTVHATSTSEHPPRAQHNSRPGGQSREGKTHVSAFTELTCWWRRCWMSTDGPYVAELGKAHTASQQIWKRARRHRKHGPWVISEVTYVPIPHAREGKELLGTFSCLLLYVSSWDATYESWKDTKYTWPRKEEKKYFLPTTLLLIRSRVYKLPQDWWINDSRT